MIVAIRAFCTDERGCYPNASKVFTFLFTDATSFNLEINLSNCFPCQPKPNAVLSTHVHFATARLWRSSTDIKVQWNSHRSTCCERLVMMNELWVSSYSPLSNIPLVFPWIFTAVGRFCFFFTNWQSRCYLNFFVAIFDETSYFSPYIAVVLSGLVQFSCIYVQMLEILMPLAPRSLLI